MISTLVMRGGDQITVELDGHLITLEAVEVRERPALILSVDSTPHLEVRDMPEPTDSGVRRTIRIYPRGT